MLLGSFNTDGQDAGTLSHSRDVIDIYSNSWGPPDIGFIVSGPGPFTNQALMEGATEVIQMYTNNYYLKPLYNGHLEISISNLNK